MKKLNSLILILILLSFLGCKSLSKTSQAVETVTTKTVDTTILIKQHLLYKPEILRYNHLEKQHFENDYVEVLGFYDTVKNENVLIISQKSFTVDVKMKVEKVEKVETKTSVKEIDKTYLLTKQKKYNAKILLYGSIFTIIVIIWTIVFIKMFNKLF